MNKRLQRSVLTPLVLGVLLGVLFNWAPPVALAGEAGVNPVKNNGAKWRVALYQGGDYGDYSKILMATVKGLMALGWIEAGQMPEPQTESTQKIWSWLCDDINSEYIDFVSDGFYSADWDDALRERLKKQLFSRVENKKDIDLILAVGTWAAQDVAREGIKVPGIGISISDPIASGIIKSVEDSGNDYFTARVDPARDEQQIRIFHDIVGFKKLGVPYENSVEGRSYAAVNVIERLARELNFEIVSEFTRETNVTSKEIAVESVKTALKKLIKTADAIYIPVAPNGISSESIADLVEITNQGRIPTFSQSGSEEVRQGFFMSISQSEFRYVGEFNANTIARIFNGAKPGTLNQLFEAPPKIAINLKTAEIIGFDLPVDVLVAADEIYQEIETPSK
jgi:ABC-type uncharacterized transport system substrate-binding protein